MSIMDSWSERVGDAFEEARNDLLTHTAECPRCSIADICEEGQRLLKVTEEAEKNFNDFIDYEEDTRYFGPLPGGEAMSRKTCKCPVRCKYCGAVLRHDWIGHHCPTKNCQWEHGVPSCVSAEAKR